jgi:ESS family glutamate:Na+ symporter
MLTGTASTGMILLRELDPNLETPAANNLVMQQIPAIAFGAPILLLVPFAGKSFDNSLLVLGICGVLFVVYNVILLRKFIFKKKNKLPKE